MAKDRAVIVMPAMAVYAYPRIPIRSEYNALSGTPPLLAMPGMLYNARFNPYGAVTLWMEGGDMGAKPGEFDFVVPFAYAWGRTMLPDEDNRIPGHEWAVLGCSGFWNVDEQVDGIEPEDWAIVDVRVGPAGWRVELEGGSDA